MHASGWSLGSLGRPSVRNIIEHQEISVVYGDLALVVAIVSLMGLLGLLVLLLLDEESVPVVLLL